ncbi:MAG: hypothetical protein ACKVJP_12490 [Flavobacteriales bacterium]
MSEITIVNEEGNQESKNFSKGYLTFPFDGDQFKDFIGGLLGKPQSISKRISGNFEIHLADLQSLFELVNQRIVQQNNGKLIQFTTKIYFTDRSSVQLGSYEELVTYNEVKPIISEAVKLTWDFLIQFSDKEHPEKQSIELLIISATERIVLESDDIPSFLLPSKGQFRINIEHTARSWGIIGAFIVTGNFINSEMEKVNVFIDSEGHTINEKMNFLTSYIASGVSPQHYFKVGIFLLISIVLSIVFGTWIDETASKNVQPSFVVLTRKAKEYRDEITKKTQKKWTWFFISIGTSIITGLITNYIFKLLVE